jgi:hypothetical protein
VGDGARCVDRRYARHMCRSIKTLRDGPTPASDEEITAAALQFVRKVSGYRKPSNANEAAFHAAVEEVAQASKRLLEVVAHTHPHAHRAH